jgi:putative DNA primase/helicase
VDPGQIILDFRAAMADAGLSTEDEIVADGKLHRFDVEGDRRGSENGWYVLYIDEHPAGAFGSWKTGEKQTWTAKVDRKLTGAERKQLEKRITEQRKVRDEEEKRVQAEAKKRAEDIWRDSGPVQRHAYLERKAIRPFAIRVSRDNLVVPLRSGDGALHSLQFIDPDGNKRFLSGGRVEGCYTTIATTGSSLEVLCICEGYATGVSIHQATDLPVIVAFNAGNILPVAKELRKKYPDSRIVICADNDQWTAGNPGIKYGTEAAQAIGARLSFPEFKHASDTNRLTDFNDLASSEGLPRVAEIIEGDGHSDNAVLPQEEQFEGHAHVAGEHDILIPSGRELSIPSYIDFPFVDKYKPLAMIENVEAFLEACNIRVRYDVIRKDLEITIPGTQYLVDTARNDKMTWLISSAARYKLPTTKIPEFVSHVAGQNPYNPIAEWITSRPWDGRSRLQDFYNTIQAKNEADDLSMGDLKETLMKRWMLSAVAAAFRPMGVSAHGVLTLQGDQYIGKTAWFKSLVSDELRELIADGMLLDPKDKDSVYQVVTHWLVELGEIDATFKKADIAQLKSFLTKDKDVLRRPYARSESEFARRTVFFASVNPEDFLSDPTGNRRFWTIPCEAINHQHKLDMQQIWAEFYTLYQAGESWYLTAGELGRLNSHNKGFESGNAAEELVKSALCWNDPPTLWKKRTATEIAMLIGFREPNERILKQVAKAVREKTGLCRGKSGDRYVYLVPDPLPRV